MDRNVRNWERIASVAAGAAMVVFAMKSRRFRRTAGMTGLGLVARGVSGLCPVNAALGRVRSDYEARQVRSGSPEYV